MSTLIPKQVWVGTETKVFGLEKGQSDGSPLHILFDVPEGISKRELKLMILEEKRDLDILSLTMEAAKGSLTNDMYRKRMARVREAYGKILGRENADERNGSDRPEGGSGDHQPTG